MPIDDIPPEWMWPFGEEVSNWFEDIRQEKKQARDAGPGDTVVPLVKNEDPRLMKMRALRG